MVEARAVRKAVRVEAARNAYGVPVEVSSVREPIGEVDWEEVIEGSVLLDELMERFDIWDAGVAGLGGLLMEM